MHFSTAGDSRIQGQPIAKKGCHYLIWLITEETDINRQLSKNTVLISVLYSSYSLSRLYMKCNRGISETFLGLSMNSYMCCMFVCILIFSSFNMNVRDMQEQASFIKKPAAALQNHVVLPPCTHTSYISN